jgi:hypothetical protein
MKIILDKDEELAQTILRCPNRPSRQGAYAGIMLRVVAYDRAQQALGIKTFELNRWTLQLDDTMETYWDRAWWEEPYERDGVQQAELQGVRHDEDASREAGCGVSGEVDRRGVSRGPGAGDQRGAGCAGRW